MMIIVANTNFVSIGHKVQEAVNSLKDWVNQNTMELNTDKTKNMWIGFTRSCPAPPNISIGDETIERVTLLGVSMQNNLKWKSHVQDIVTKASKIIYFVTACMKANQLRI